MKQYSNEEWRLVELNKVPDRYQSPESILGPTYPDLGQTVAKFRRKAAAAGSIREMERADRVAYADAIEKAIRAKHRTLHMKPTPPMTPGWYNPPSITRLLRWEHPVQMAGDPQWDKGHDRDGCRWELREKAVYVAAMRAKGNLQAIEALQAAE